MIRFYTAGESHGKGLTVWLDGFPAGLELDVAFINHHLARRQKGYGRGGRMAIETDEIEILNGTRFCVTTGAPLSLWVKNRDYQNWTDIMDPMGQAPDGSDEKAFHRPRPGHADLAGHFKYGHQDLRNVLERSSARETAARVAAGGVALCLLRAFGISIYSHVTGVGGVEVDRSTLPTSHDAIEARAESNDFRCAGPDDLLTAMKARIDDARKEGVTLGGRVEVVALNVPPGLGSYGQWDRKLDGQLAQALMSIPAVKAVSLGDGFLGSQVDGSQFHDAITFDADGRIARPTNRAGGLEGGVTNGQPVVAEVVMKPISTMLKALDSVNLKTGQAEQAHFERSDVTAVAACGVVAEAMMALTLANALVEKLGGDSLEEMQAHFKATLAHQPCSAAKGG
ncbi:MAG: chorismate synthase [Cyanobacteria bacterium HKST-UBA06]|nr:chorismate synthase [Cyanobacteria bacterium HKST-UBA06]